MFMEPIVAAKAPPSAALRRSVGTMFVLLGIAAIVPWLAAVGLWTGGAMALRGLRALPRTAIQLVDHVGNYALGR